MATRRGCRLCWLMADLSKQPEFWKDERGEIGHSNEELEGHPLPGPVVCFLLRQNKSPLEKTMKEVK